LQYPNCYSQNIWGRDLTSSNARDDAFKDFVIRVTLDGFWSHASSTMVAHVSEIRLMCSYGDTLGFHPTPPLVSFTYAGAGSDGIETIH
jgi:hypothetical protein